MKGVAVIIPAYNEEARIASVLRAATGASLPEEIIVVSDGSCDRTAEVARRFPGVRVVDLKVNVGKGGAMAEGVRATRARYILFLDADLLGLVPEHVDGILRPLVENRCDMCVGVFRGGKHWSDTAQRIAPQLSGQRALRRDLFESVPYVHELRLGVEVALNTTAKRRKARIMRVILRGVSNFHKEQKLGILKGTAARAKMYAEIGQAVVKTHKAEALRRMPWR